MSVDSAYAVELKGLTFKRGSRSIFSNVDIRIPRGKVMTYKDVSEYVQVCMEPAQARHAVPRL